MSTAAIVTVDELASFQAGDAQSALDTATSDVRGHCGWHVTPSITETVTFPPWTGRTLLLPSLHVTAVASVTEDGIPLAMTDYSWTPVGLLTRARTFYPRLTSPMVVAVTFTHGWTEASDLAGVIKALASRSQDAPGGGFVRQVGQVSYQNPKGDGGLLVDEKAILSRYRIPQTS